MTDATQSQINMGRAAAKVALAKMINSFGLPGWEESYVDQYITDDRVNAVADAVTTAVVNAPPEVTS